MSPNHTGARWAGALLKGAVAGAVGAVALGARPALAASAFDILIPKPAEFFPALIAFVVIWVVLAKLIWPSVLKTLDARQQTIQDNIDESEKAKVEAAKALRESEDILEEAQTKADGIMADARKAAEDSRNRILAEARDEAEEIKEKGRATIEVERAAALEGLTDQVAELSVDLAAKIIGESLDEDAQHRVIERYLAKAGDVDAD